MFHCQLVICTAILQLRTDSLLIKLIALVLTYMRVEAHGRGAALIRSGKLINVNENLNRVTKFMFHELVSQDSWVHRRRLA